MIHNDDFIFGIHAVLEAVNAGKDIDKVFVKKDLTGNLAVELMEVLKDNGIIVQRVPVEKLNRMTRKNHQGVIAALSPIAYADLDNIIPELYEAGKVPFIMLLDGITDVRNFGAIARSCECAGVDAIVIPEKNSVSVNADAVKTSAGALLHIPVARVRNLYQAVRRLQNSGIKVVGATEKTDVNYTKVDYTMPTAIVMGAEDTGISTDVLKVCDSLAAIPIAGKINSLNVSVAAAVMAYEVVRQRFENPD